MNYFDRMRHMKAAYAKHYGKADPVMVGRRDGMCVATTVEPWPVGGGHHPHPLPAEQLSADGACDWAKSVGMPLVLLEPMLSQPATLYTLPAPDAAPLATLGFEQVDE